MEHRVGAEPNYPIFPQGQRALQIGAEPSHYHVYREGSSGVTTALTGVYAAPIISQGGPYPCPERRRLDALEDMYVLVAFDPGAEDRDADVVASWLQDAGLTAMRH